MTEIEMSEVQKLREAFAPFLNTRDQATSEMVKIISKRLKGFAPVTVTVTKDQFLAALSAFNASAP